MKKVPLGTVVLLLGISLFGLFLRLYRIGAPLADWHSWRQADTAAVARNFEKFGIDVLRPRYDDLSNIQSGKDNPEGWRMVEMPLYQLAGVGVHRLIPALTIESSLRLVSAIASGLGMFLLGLLLFSYVGIVEAVAGTFLYAVLPYAVYYGRTILPDAFAIFWALLSMVLLALESRRLNVLWLTLSAICAAVALLTRPMAGFLLLPALFIVMRKKGISINAAMTLFVYAAISIVPLLWWRRWILLYPTGIPASEWLLNNNGIRFKGAWFYWLFAKRIGELILGYWGLIPFGVGLIVKAKSKDGLLSFLFFLGALLYMIIFAGGNVQHDYYQVLLLPVIVWFSAKGIGFLLGRSEGIHRVASWAVAGSSIALAIAFSWYTVRTYYWINRPEIVEAGQMADQLLPKSAKVIASYNGDTTFLYQTKRQGWPLGFEIEKKIALGATHYVTVSPTDSDGETRALASEYTVLIRNEKFAIIDLTKPNASKAPNK